MYKVQNRHIFFYKDRMNTYYKNLSLKKRLQHLTKAFGANKLAQYILRKWKIFPTCSTLRILIVGGG